MRYRKIDAEAQAFKGSLMQNISEGGVCLSTYEFLPLHIKLAMEIPLVPGSSPIRGTSRVAWVKSSAFGDQYEVGAEFTDITQEEILRIGKFVFNKSLEKII